MYQNPTKNGNLNCSDFFKLFSPPQKSHLELSTVSPSAQQLHETNAACEQEHLCGSNTVLGGHSIFHDPQPCRRHSYRVQLESAICVHVISRLEQEPQSAFVRIVIKNYNSKSQVIVNFESFKRCYTQPWAASLSVLGGQVVFFKEGVIFSLPIS